MNIQSNHFGPSPLEIQKAIRLLADHDGNLHLIGARFVNQDGREIASLDLNLLEELRIHWFAIQRKDAMETILLPPLYSEKFYKVARRWNRTKSSMRVEMKVNLIGCSEAASFYLEAPQKNPEIMKTLLQCIERDTRRNSRMIRNISVE